jgi:hypothetical protein
VDDPEAADQAGPAVGKFVEESRSKGGKVVSPTLSAVLDIAQSLIKLYSSLMSSQWYVKGKFVTGLPKCLKIQYLGQL